MLSSLYTDACLFVNRHFAGLFKGVNLEWNEELEDAINFVRMGVTPREVMVFAWFSGLVFMIFALFSALVALFLGISALYVLLAGMIVSIGAIFLFRTTL